MAGIHADAGFLLVPVAGLSAMAFLLFLSNMLLLEVHAGTAFPILAGGFTYWTLQ